MAQHDSEGIYIPAEHTDDDIPSSLCQECKFYNPTEKVSNCYDENSFQVFCITHKIWAIIISCEEFEDKKAIEKIEVMPGHEFENDVMKLAQAEEQILAQTEVEAKKEMTKQAQEAEVQQEVKEKGGNDANHRTE